MNTPVSMLSKSQFAEKYKGILQPLEVIISHYYRQHHEIHDHDVLKAYEALLKLIKAKLTKFPLPENKLTGVAGLLYDPAAQFPGKYI